jgi:hypothetical protein
LYYSRDNDPFQEVKEWWNTDGKKYAGPSAHLFEQMHITLSDKVLYPYGRGKVYIVKQDPKELILLPGMDSSFVQMVRQAYEKEAHAGKLETKNYFYLERGPYDISSVMDEGVSAAPLHIKGPVIDMFDPLLPVLQEKMVNPGQQSLLYDISRVKEKNIPKVLCAASRVYEEKRGEHAYSFITKSPTGTQNVMRVLLPARPLTVSITDATGQLLESKNNWDDVSATCLLQFVNAADGINVEIKW